MHRTILTIILTLLATASFAEVATVKHRISGLFQPDREADLKAAAEKLQNIKLVSIDYQNAEAIFEYDAAKAFPGAKPEQVVERLDNQLKSVSRGTFGVKPALQKPVDKLQQIEITVVGLDCKGCAWAAYDALNRIDGVERATVSFKEGRAIALVDSDKTNQAALEAALKQRGVQLKRE
jgi:copper chaperone CopZ